MRVADRLERGDVSEQDLLRRAAAIEDPIERARALGRILTEYQAIVTNASRMRRQAIEEALASGMTQDQVAKAVGLSPGRISQMRKAGTASPVVTGWSLDPSTAPIYRVAICGSRADGTNGEVIDAAIRALAALLQRHRFEVKHGPVGVGIEVLTYIADHIKPPGLDTLSGIIGHENLIRDVDYVLIVGGGKGTLVEAHLALSASLKILPMPTSGGTAARVYQMLEREPKSREWLSNETFAQLATANADEYARIVEAEITGQKSDSEDTHE